MTAAVLAEDQPKRAAASSGLLCPSVYYPRQPVDSFHQTGGLGEHGHGRRPETAGITSVLKLSRSALALGPRLTLRTINQKSGKNEGP